MIGVLWQFIQNQGDLVYITNDNEFSCIILFYFFLFFSFFFFSFPPKAILLILFLSTIMLDLLVMLWMRRNTSSFSVVDSAIFICRVLIRNEIGFCWYSCHVSKAQIISIVGGIGKHEVFSGTASEYHRFPGEE